jgi:hypothetical protein
LTQIDECAQRLPFTLTRDRDMRRRQKVVDSNTGEIVGYARWIPPDDDDTILWPEVQIAEPSQEEKAAFDAACKAALVDGRIKDLNKPVESLPYASIDEIEKGLMKDGPYLHRLK